MLEKGLVLNVNVISWINVSLVQPYKFIMVQNATLSQWNYNDLKFIYGRRRGPRKENCEKVDSIVDSAFAGAIKLN